MTEPRMEQITAWAFLAQLLINLDVTGSSTVLRDSPTHHAIRALVEYEAEDQRATDESKEGR